nr:MAG TPA: tail tape measure protein [Caudoviricetes sp.]
MDQETGRLYFDVLLNDESLQQGLQRSRESFRSLGESANAELQSMDGFMAKAAQTAAGLFAVDKIKDFVSQLALVRGEYQQLEIAFETMLGSKSQADALMAQLINTAATTPFEMKEIAESAKMLLAYGMAADEVNGTLIRLGDIAAGLSIPIKDLAFLYGTTMVQGRLYTQDLNQFLGRGIPLADELAKQFGKNKSEVKKLVEEGKIGFPEVQKAIEALTGEGSKFGGLMEAQSKTISGQISNIEDAWEQMMNEIGRSQEGNISGALDITGKLIENWRTVGKVVLTAAAAIGSYKAAVVTLAAIRKVSDTATVLNTGQQLRSVLTLEQQARLSKMKLSTSSLAYAKAVQTEVHAELQKQKALVQTTKIEVQAAEKEIAVATMWEKKAAEAVAVKRSQVGAALMSGKAKRLEAATTALSTAQERLNTAEKAKNTAIQSLSSKQAALNTAAKRVNTLETAANTAAQTAGTGATNLLSMAIHGLGKAIMSNPIGLLVGAITTAATAMFFFTKSTDETTEMSERFGESAAKSIQQVDMLGTALMGLDEGTGVYKKTMDELNTILEEYGIAQIKEGDNIDSINEKRKQAIELIKEEGVERQRLNAIQTAGDDYQKELEDKQHELEKKFKNVQYDTGLRDNEGATVWGDIKEVQKSAKMFAQIYHEIAVENAGKTGEEIERLFKERLRRMRDAKKIALSDKEINSTWFDGIFFKTETLGNYANEVKELSDAYEKNKTVANANAKAAKELEEAHMSSAERIEAGQRKILNASKTADDLYNNVSKIVKDFADNTLNFHINFDGEPPAWMLKMDFEETRRLAAYFSSTAEDMRKNGQKVAVFSNGKTMSVGEMEQNSLNYAKAHQIQAARQEAARKKAEESRKQAAKDAKAEAKRRAKAAADARKKAEEERKRIALEKHDLEKDIEKYKDSIIEKEYESSLEIRQNKINLLEDGYEKERQQIELNYERLLYENKKRSDAMVEAIKENKMREWKVANPKATKEKENAYRDKLNVTEKDFDPSQRAMLAQYESVAEETRVKASGDLYKRAIAEFQDYDTRRTEIAKEGEQKRASIEAYFSQYARQLQEEIAQAGKDKNDALAKFDSEAHTAAEKREKEASQKLADIAGTKERALEESKRKQEKDIKAVNDEEIESTKKTSALFVNLFGDAAEKSRKELHKVITETELLLAYLRETPDEKIVPSFGFSAQELRNLKQAPEKVKEITDQLKRLKDAVKTENPFAALSEAINDVFRKAEQGESLPALEVRLKKLASAASATADVIAPISAKLSTMFEAAGSQNLSEQADALTETMTTVSNIGKGFAQGGIVGGIAAAAGEAIGYVTKAFQAAAAHKKALLEIQKQINDQQQQYNELLRQERLEARDLETIFGTDKYAKARRALLVAKDWDADIKERIKGDLKTLADYRFSLEKKEQWAGGRILFDPKAEGDHYGLGMISVKTGHAKSGFFGLGKGRDLYSGLTQIAEYKDLVKANGHLNLELAKSIAATREFEGDGKKAFESLIKAEESYEAALKQMDDYLGGIFGNYATDIMDVVADAFERGADAAEAFGDVTRKVMRNVAKDMVQAAVLQPVIEQQSELVKKAYATGNRDEITKALGAASHAFADVEKVVQEEYKKAAEEFKRQGIDLSGSSAATREASQKGIATASQDSVDELNGRMTAVQGHTYNIAENTRMLLATSNEILKGVVGIERNTGNVHARLSVVEQHLKSVKDTVGDIALKGIKIKQ